LHQRRALTGTWPSSAIRSGELADPPTIRRLNNSVKHFRGIKRYLITIEAHGVKRAGREICQVPGFDVLSLSPVAD